VVGISGLIIAQREQLQAIFEESLKPSVAECKFAGQRLSGEYYCSYQYVGNGEGYYDARKIPTKPSEVAQKAKLDLRQAVEKCDTLLDVGYDCTVMGDGSTMSGTRSLGQEGKLSDQEWESKLEQKRSYNHSLLSDSTAVGGTGTDVQPWQRVFVKEIFSDVVKLPTFKGIHTSNAKAVSISVYGTSPVVATIEETDCFVVGVSFERLCDVPPNSEITLRIDGMDKTRVTVRLHYLL
jgi:hypothetical protein